MRTASLTLLYEGHNISTDIGPDLLSFSFTDKADGEADDVQVAISDRNKKWQNGWMPKRGATLTPSIVCRNWFAEGDQLTLECGAFQVDEIEFDFGEMDKLTLKGIPCAVKAALVGQKKTRAWEATSLQGIAADVATEGGLALIYKGGDVPMSRIDQRQEPDLAFLTRVATENGFRTKAADGKLIILEGKLADALAPLTLSRTEGSTFNVRLASAEVYKGSKVSYTDPATGNLLEALAQDHTADDSGKFLELNTSTENLAAAHRVAAGKLREKNAGQQEGSWSGMGDPRIRAGMTLRLSGFGRLSEATYTVKDVTHSLSPSEGYTTSANLQTALEY